ncbi:putative RNase H-like nuclease [Embleya sp. AB8]
MTAERKPRPLLDYGVRVVDIATGFMGIVDGFRGEEALLRPLPGSRTPCGCPTTNALITNLRVQAATNERPCTHRTLSGQAS